MSVSSEKRVWCDANGLRIWRCADSDFSGDEIRDASRVYTEAVFAEIAEAGFNAVWLRGKLRDLTQSNVLPELNRDDARARMQSLRETIARGQKHGVQVFLFFNEPLAVSVDESFWQKYPALAGQRHRDFGADHDVDSLCTTTPLVQQYLREAVAELLSGAVGLGGVILITASEYHTHCWSHYAKYTLNDGVEQPASTMVHCPRCRDRSPAEIVGELTTVWHDAAVQCSSVGYQPRVLCWNWSWSMWYPDPQTEVIENLPKGVELLLDLERGTRVTRHGKTLDVDEYSLSVVGPGERFCQSRQVAERCELPVHAKVQLGTTHEIATVPNLPLIQQVHAKFVELRRHNVAGIMGTWNFGCSLTLNTAAVALFVADPDKYEDFDEFASALAQRYLGIDDATSIRQAWEKFGKAFEHYPFSTVFLYWSPVNEAPAYSFRLRYEAKPLGGSWLAHEWGDRLEDSLATGTTIDDIAESLGAVAAHWREGLAPLKKSFASVDGNPTQLRHRAEELSCAQMIGIQLESAANIYRFHAWKQNRMRDMGIKPPCDIPLDEQGRAILVSEYDLACQARELCVKDARLGYHQECHAYFYNPKMIEQKIQDIKGLLDPVIA